MSIRFSSESEKKVIAPSNAPKTSFDGVTAVNTQRLDGAGKSYAPVELVEEEALALAALLLVFDADEELLDELALQLLTSAQA